MQNTEDLVRAHIAAFNQRDMPALVAGLADDVVWITGAGLFAGSGGAPGPKSQARRSRRH